MTNKREHFDNQDGESALNHKRTRFNNLDGRDDLPASSQSRIDPTYGQRGAFPGLEDSHDDGGLFYGPASDGLEYLRMVRSEAKTVPNLLVAPISPTVQSKKNDIYADYPQGYYSNGAYTATPVPFSNHNQEHTNGGQQEDQDPQEAYYDSLCARFTELTEVLQSPPSRAAPDNTEVYYLDWRSHRVWRGKILNTTPTMVLLAQLTQESVICGLEVLEFLLTFANRRGKKGKNIGAWTWGLLGRCREVGQMGSEEVGVLRKLGKQAVCLLRRINEGGVIGEAVDEPDMDAGEEDDEEGEGKEERVEDGADFLDAVDADDGHSPYIDPITTAAEGHDGNSEAHPVATMSDADLAKAKQHILDSLGPNQAQNDSTETKASNKNDRQSPTLTYPASELEVDDITTAALSHDGNSEAPPIATMSDADFPKAKQHISNSLGPNQTQTDFLGTNASNKDDIQIPTPTHPVTELGIDDGGLDEKTDEKATIHATLDMLVTIIGELYGQKDLLDGRLLWDEMQ